MSLLLDLDGEICAFPIPGIHPEDRKPHNASRCETRRRQIRDMKADAGIARLDVVDGSPIVPTPMNDRRGTHFDTKNLLRLNAAALVTEPPQRER